MIKVMFLIILPTMVFSQINISPLDIPLNLSGTFGELRSTHFHTGIDIKTGGKQGLKVRSIKKGQVVRVRVSRGGYGKSIYIKHYDGTTSVYAHLKKFSKKVEDYVKKIQYKNKTYEMQSFPKEGQLNFDLGELIGFSGNTGGTSGPHLHFEIRDSNNNPLNPFELDFEITDTIKPVISGLYLYKVYDDGKYDFIKKIKIKKINNSLYAASKIKNTGRLGIGLKYYDRQDKSYSKNGVYSINFNLNADSIFNYKVDQLNFNDRKYLKLLIDHKKWNKERVRVQKLFTHPKSKYSFINKRKSYGVFTISDGLSYDGEIKVIDFKGNQTKIKLNFEGIIKDSIQNISKSGNINPDKEYTIDLKNISIKIPKNSFYNSIDIKINSNNDTLDLGENIHLINKGFEIKYQVSKTDSVFLKKGFISKINKYGNARYLKTKKENNFWSTKGYALGKYALSIDTISPTVKPYNFKKNEWISNLKFLKLKVKDEFSGIKLIEGSINGIWILFEFEPKSNLITYNFKDLTLEDGKHLLKIKVEDMNGNITNYESIFFKKY